MRELAPDDRQLLEKAVQAHAPKLESLLATIGHRKLSVEEREGLRGALANELTSAGLDKRDEPTEYGLKLDELIGRLMHF